MITWRLFLITWIIVKLVWKPALNQWRNINVSCSHLAVFTHTQYIHYSHYFVFFLFLPLNEWLFYSLPYAFIVLWTVSIIRFTFHHLYIRFLIQNTNVCLVCNCSENNPLLLHHTSPLGTYSACWSLFSMKIFTIFIFLSNLIPLWTHWCVII